MTLKPAFVKHPTPIVEKGNFPHESGDLANPDILIDTLLTRGYKYVMNYSAYGTVAGDSSPKWRMCLAYSHNLLDWVKEPLNPVFSPASGEGYICCNGTIVFKQGLYYHFYQTGTTGSYTAANIRLATSTDLINWTRINGGAPIISRTPGGPDSVGLFDPHVVLEGETFVMRYTAYSDDETTSCVLAKSEDGITWTKYGEEVVAQPAEFENPGEPCGLKLGLKQLFSFDAYVNGSRKIGGAVQYNNGPTQYLGFFVEPSFAWDTANVFDSCMHYEERKIYLFFAGGTNVSGNEGMNSNIGVAIAEYNPYNVEANKASLYIARQDASFDDLEITPENTTSIVKIGNPNLGYDPSLTINNIEGFEQGEFYYFKPKKDRDLSHVLKK